MNTGLAAFAAEIAVPALRWGGGRWGDAPSALPLAFHFAGVLMFLLLALLVGVLFFVARRKGRGPWAPQPREAPEVGAQRLLAERFARGDIGVDEFMERASVLNWTPGVPPGAGK
ncbi:SHOCT domain-containing protein [Actinorugispora endophytica]|uniref:SHOCT domain-containing protein n=1 Tax=Actinorugispora endophytica TaxID=1605990 RepID=A0A4R6UI96_9ACTN|nr:SHOCT domain-containing protein [Actinorugispora endophytica]TDQ46598.1 hypothetical protein EV190_12433 [Actinorugispora endophytica]